MLKAQVRKNPCYITFYYRVNSTISNEKDKSVSILETVFSCENTCKSFHVLQVQIITKVNGLKVNCFNTLSEELQKTRLTNYISG